MAVENPRGRNPPRVLNAARRTDGNGVHLAPFCKRGAPSASMGGSGQFTTKLTRPSSVMAATAAAFFTGVTRDSALVAVPNVPVYLFDSATDALLAQTVSDGSGNFSFQVPGNATPYFVAGFDDPNSRSGITLRNVYGVFA